MDQVAGDSSSDSKSESVPCRKSKRLLFKNNHKTIADKKLSGEEDSISPYGRLVELIDHQPELNRQDFLTKCLFLGSLDLTFTDPGAPPKPAVVTKTNKATAESSTNKTRTRRHCTSTTPKTTFNVPSLKTLCIRNIVKRKKHEFVQREVEYFRQVENNLSKSCTNSNTKTSHNNPEGPWLNFGEYAITNLLPPPPPPQPKKGNSRLEVPLEECVERLHRYGTEITFTNGTSQPSRRRTQNNNRLTLGSRTSGDCDDEGTWFNWGEHMTKILQIESNNILTKKVVETVQGASVKQKSRKVTRSRKQTVRA